MTEHSSYRNQIFYYRKELWACVEKLAVKERTDSLLTQISLVTWDDTKWAHKHVLTVIFFIAWNAMDVSRGKVPRSIQASVSAQTDGGAANYQPSVQN